jgi:FtsP/CotA-like multicopper oxidase with cupredoxin domain
MSFLVIVASVLLAVWSAPVASELIRHDSSWSPDTTLYATAANITIDCQSRYSVLLNGTSPGPTLYLEEGKTTWIRVYNQILDQNITVVRVSTLRNKHWLIEKALAWSFRKGSTILRWHPTGEPMAHRARTLF